MVQQTDEKAVGRSQGISSERARPREAGPEHFHMAVHPKVHLLPEKASRDTAVEVWDEDAVKDLAGVEAGCAKERYLPKHARPQQPAKKAEEPSPQSINANRQASKTSPLHKLDIFSVTTGEGYPVSLAFTDSVNRS